MKKLYTLIGIALISLSASAQVVPPSEFYNTIYGATILDANNNGCDPNDSGFPGVTIHINNGNSDSAVVSNASGMYSFYTQGGVYTLTPQFENAYFSTSPESITINYEGADSLLQPQNFCITPTGTYNDLEITLIPVNPFRPGFDAELQLTYKNKGTNMIASGTVNLTFPDSVLDLIAAAPSPDNQATNHLSWNYANLSPFESRTINITLNINGPMETPAVNIDDILNFTATVNPIDGDETAGDNVFELPATVVGSFDPNDKTCLNGVNIDPDMIGNFLHYLIRFQNTGTAPAEDIIINDVIDVTKFDISSLQPVSASHPFQTSVQGDNVEFIFNDIQLPGGTNNPLSHGFVTFKIKTKANLPVGSTVSNKADIFFDYNFPITTNTVTSHFNLLGTQQFDGKTIAVYPNPVKDKLSITAKDDIKSVQVYDVLGRQIQGIQTAAKDLEIDFTRETSGVYFVKINTEKGTKTERILKQ